MTKKISRRRFISIAAAAGAAVSLPLLWNSKYSVANKFYHWRGFAMGADAEIKLYSPESQGAKNLTEQCLEEILRLEKIFSLYEPESVISRLNRDGIIHNPPAEFVELVNIAKRYGEITDGTFDITVQPLWNNPASKAARELVDYRKIIVGPDSLKFADNGMAITMNGIAQGYITDKVTELLKRNGVENVLVNMGETRAIGAHPVGKAWQVGIQNPDNIGEVIKTTELNNMAISTSGNYGARKDHIFDPKTGKPVSNYKSVSVIAPTATQADVLSTAFYIMARERADTIVATQNIKTFYII